MNEYYIDYLCAKADYKKKRVEFKTYKQAVEWGKKNLENFHIDMVKELSSCPTV